MVEQTLKRAGGSFNGAGRSMVQQTLERAGRPYTHTVVLFVTWTPSDPRLERAVRIFILAERSLAVT
jgi:hypothetical protein